MLDALLVFDCETVPDTDCVPRLLDVQSSDAREREHALVRHYGERGQPFLKPLFHRVVAISYLFADIQRDGKCESYRLRYLRTGGGVESSEREILEGFFTCMEKRRPRLVTFNGRGFDVPVLKYRALRHGLAAPAFYAGSGADHGYLKRYAHEWHCDLADVLSDYTATRMPTLTELCAVLGLPGKVGNIDGAKVSDLVHAGRITAVRDYCEVDVANTYLIYLRYALQRGIMQPEAYRAALRDFDGELRRQLIEGRRHWREFLDAWEGPPPRTREAEA